MPSQEDLKLQQPPMLKRERLLLRKEHENVKATLLCGALQHILYKTEKTSSFYPQTKSTGQAGLEPATTGFGDRDSTS